MYVLYLPPCVLYFILTLSLDNQHPSMWHLRTLFIFSSKNSLNDFSFLKTQKFLFFEYFKFYDNSRRRSSIREIFNEMLNEWRFYHF